MPFGRRKSSSRELLHSAQQHLEEEIAREKEFRAHPDPFSLLRRFLGRSTTISTSRDPRLKKEVLIKNISVAQSAARGKTAKLDIQGLPPMEITPPRQVRDEGKKIIFDYSESFEKPDRGKQPFELEISFEFKKDEDYEEYLKESKTIRSQSTPE